MRTHAKCMRKYTENHVVTHKEHEDIHRKPCGHMQKASGHTQETMWTHAKNMRTYAGNHVDTRKKHEDIRRKPCEHTQKA